MSDVKDLLKGVSDTDLPQILRIARELEAREQENIALSMDLYESQMRVANSENMILALFGGNQCLGENTVIYDPVLSVSRRVGEIEEDHHVLAWDGHALVVAKAGKPFVKAVEDIYEFTLLDGQVFEASLRHLVLGDFGWQGLQEVACDLHRTTLDTDPSTHAQGVLRSSGRVQDSLGDCHPSRHSNGGPLHRAQASYREPAPSPAYAQECSASHSVHGFERGDGLERRPEHSRVCRVSCRPSSPDDLGLIEVRVVDTESQNERRLSIPVSDLHRAGLQSMRGFDLLLSTDGSGPLANHKLDDQGVRLSAASSCPLFASLSNIVSMRFLRKGPIYDFEVPEFGNYYAAGIIHHNSGKSTTGALRTAWDATGIYPEWYTGPRTTRPVDIWVIGETNTTTRDTCQRKLLGDLDTFEGGFIPKRLHVGRPSTRQNIPKAVDTIRIKHVSGGSSTITFKSYEQGREALASWTGDRVWVDEEPPFDCYEELVMRILARKGQMLLSFTPLKGKTKLVKLLLTAPQDVVCRDFLGWNEAKHLDEKQKKAIMSMYSSQPGQLKARMTGHPEVNNGLIYPFDMKDILYNVAEIPTPSGAPRLGGLDVGWTHPTAGLVGWVDPDSGARYIYGNYRQRQKPPLYHHAQLCTWGNDLRFEIDPASNAGDKGSGEKILEMFWEEAHGPDWRHIDEHERKYVKAINAVAAGIQQTFSDFSNGMLFISSALKPLIEELEGYAWDDDGLKPVKEDDDLCDALRYFEMGVAAGHARPLGQGAPRYHAMFQPQVEQPRQWGLNGRKGY